MMADIHLTMAIFDYDHVRDLSTGRVKPEGIDLTVINHDVEEIFHRMMFGQEFDVSEISMGMSTSRVSQGDAPFVLLPIFPSRVFRLSSIYVKADGPIKTPADLKGKRIGVPEWGQTAGIYTRGWMVHQAGVALKDVEWFQSGINDPGRQEAAKLDLPEEVNLTVVTDRSLTQMMFDGDLDAAFSARAPKAFLDKDPRMVRLFPDYRKAEQAYFEETGIFPIMHTVAMRRDVFEKNRWAAMNIMTAFEEAKRRSRDRILNVTASQIGVPWLNHDAEVVNRALFGDDWWPYGIEGSRTTLEAFLQYGYEQGTLHKKMTPEDLFPEEVQHFFKY
jgi:4,5-dihydroxyphthalate decarboxylase